MSFISSRIMTLTYFEIEHGYQPIDAFFYILEGSFLLKTEDDVRIIEKNNLVFFPRDMEFERKMISPITFYNVQADSSENFSRGYTAVKDHMRLKSTLETLTRLYSLPDSDKEIENHYLEDVFIQLRAERLFHKETYDRCTASAIEYMESNMAKKLSVNDVARAVGMSVTGLTEHFKKTTGCTPMRYLSLIRLKLAEELLCTTSDTLSKIAEICGYDNAFYFSNAFKKEKGVSPRLFREKNGAL